MDIEREMEALVSSSGSDNSGEMALISESFKRSSATVPTSTTHDETRTESAGEGFESTGYWHK